MALARDEFVDWMYGALHKYPITVELSGNSFYPPDEFIPGEAHRNWAAAVFVAQIADCPTKIVGVHCGTGGPTPGLLGSKTR